MSKSLIKPQCCNGHLQNMGLLENKSAKTGQQEVCPYCGTLWEFVNRKFQPPAWVETTPSKPQCCMQHLIRKNYGTMINGQFLSTCTEEGQRVRCSTCGTSWEFVIEESEGSSWVEVIPKQKRKSA